MSLLTYLQSINFAVDSITGLSTLTGSELDGLVVSVKNYSSVFGGNSLKYEYDSGQAKSGHDGYAIISPTVPWDEQIASLGDYQAAVGETDGAGSGCWILISRVLEEEIATDDAGVLAVPSNPVVVFRKLLPAAGGGADQVVLGDGSIATPGDVILFPDQGTATTDWKLFSVGPSRVIDITISTLITGEYKNALLRVDSVSDITLTLPQTSTEAIPAGFSFGVVQANTGGAIFAVQGAETLLVKSGLTKTNELGSPAQVIRTSTTEWYVGGDLA